MKVSRIKDTINPLETEGGKKGKVGHGKKPKCQFIGFFISQALFIELTFKNTKTLFQALAKTELGVC